MNQQEQDEQSPFEKCLNSIRTPEDFTGSKEDFKKDPEHPFLLRNKIYEDVFKHNFDSGQIKRILYKLDTITGIGYRPLDSDYKAFESKCREEREAEERASQTGDIAQCFALCDKITNSLSDLAKVEAIKAKIWEIIFYADPLFSQSQLYLVLEYIAKITELDLKIIKREHDKAINEFKRLEREEAARLGKHYHTGLELRMPSGYYPENGTIYYANPLAENPQPKKIIEGVLEVRELGIDLHTDSNSATVKFFKGIKGGKEVYHEVTTDRTILASRKRIIEVLTNEGAYIDDKNAQEVCSYLSAYISRNYSALPQIRTTKKLGFVEQQIKGEDAKIPLGVLTPNWYVGEGICKYTGNHKISIFPKGKEIWRNAILEAFSWENATPLHFALGLSAICPHIPKLNTRRNPVLWLIGGSGTGKSTVNHFAASLYGKSDESPFQHQGSSNPKGFAQALDNLGGLPFLVDDTQLSRREMGKETSAIEDLAFQLANKQRYTIGHISGESKGGGKLHGACFLSGEYREAMNNRGAENRLLEINSVTNPPLGVFGEEGAKRSNMLINAVNKGAGSWGEEVTKHIWDNFETVETKINQLWNTKELDMAFAPEWAKVIAASIIATQELLEVLKAPKEIYPYKEGEQFFNKIASFLKETRKYNDPARDAFEKLRGMILNHHEVDEYALTECKYNGHVYGIKSLLDRSGVKFAMQHQIDQMWYFIHNSDAVSKEIQSYVLRYGADWVKKGWVKSNGKGKAIILKKISGVPIRCVGIPFRVFQDASND